MTATLDGNNMITIGKDFVECVTIKDKDIISNGKVNVGSKTYEWKSAYEWETSHKVLRVLAKNAHQTISFIN